MPSVEENLATWNRTYDWTGRGDEWSYHWGGTDTQWHATLLPRIRPFVPTGCICEIGPGHGRWTQYLLDHCEQYIGVDLAPRCVDACRARFSASDHARFEVNDGRSLPMVPDRSVDFVFSFDSLVHVEADVIADYLSELSRILKPDGIAWLHHSNLGEFRDAIRRAERAEELVRRVPPLGRSLKKREVIGWRHWRAQSMTAARFVDLAVDGDLRCVGQEIVNWGGSRLIDCISLVTRPGSVWDRPNQVHRNTNFMNEGTSARSVSAVFTSMDGRHRTS